MSEPTLAGRYRLEQEIGAGGIGTVYRAADTRSGATVAVKILHPHLARDRDYVRRFHRGARIAQGLRSPHIVHVLDQGEDGDQHYLVMDYVPGGTLGERLRKQGRLPEQEARRLVREVALALQAAHEKGVVHRDISAENVLLTQDGTARVTDFDIARAEGATRMTSTGLFMGKVGYAAPETYGGKADIRSDLYSLGILLYELLTGHVPFEAETPLAVMDMHRSREAPGLTELSELGDGTLGRVLQRLLAKWPEERYQTPAELLAALEGRVEETAVMPPRRQRAPRSTTTSPAGSWLRWPRLGYIAVGTGAAVVVGVAIIFASLSIGGGAASEGPPGADTSVVAANTVPPPSPEGGSQAEDSVSTLAVATTRVLDDIPIPEGALVDSFGGDIGGDFDGVNCGFATDENQTGSSATIRYDASSREIVNFYEASLPEWELTYEDGVVATFVRADQALTIMGIQGTYLILRCSR